MTASFDHENQVSLMTETEFKDGFDVEKYEAKVSRFERLGIRLFSVANCLISFGQLPSRFDRSEQSIVVQESKFCESLEFVDEIQVFNDLQKNENFAKNSYVENSPFLKFCAQHPILGYDKQVVGCIYLLDYQERDFDDESRLIFADLAKMVERELVLGLIRRQHVDLQKQVRNLKRDLLIDPILGMWNRNAITRALGLELERCKKADKPFSLLYIGIDQYKDVKEKYGSTLSDSLLQRVVSRMRSCIRPFDALGRFESDAFLIVLPGASNFVAMAVAERIRLSIVSNQEMIDSDNLSITVCIGSVSSNIFPDLSPEFFISHAEKALLAARAAENNRIVQASPEQIETPL